MDLTLSVMTLAAIALTGGAIYLWRRDGGRKQALLMLTAAVVLAANVVIWSWPTPAPTRPAASTER